MALLPPGTGLAAVYPVHYIDETIDTDPNGQRNQDALDESQYGTGSNTEGDPDPNATPSATER